MKNIYLIVALWLTLVYDIRPIAAQEVLPGAVAFEEEVLNLWEPTLKNSLSGPDPVFVFSLEKDIPLIAGSGIMAIGGELLKQNVSPLTEAELAVLDPAAVNAFDRVAIRQYRVADASFSDYLLVLSYVTPLSVLAFPSAREEFVPVLMMYAETAALIGGLTSISKGLFKRKRPFTYNPDALMSDRLSVGARHSFFSGHVSNTAAFSFFTAYMVNSYAKRPAWKVVAWTGAAVLPATVGYWRYTSGKHFPSDILTGYLIGAGTGLLIPYLHRWKPPADISLNVQPFPGGLLITFTF